MEKRIYCSPSIEIVDVKVETQLLISSIGENIGDGADVGGEVDPEEGYDSKGRGGFHEYGW